MASKNSILLFSSLVGFPLSVAACSGSDGGSSVLDSCSNTYVCVDNGTSFETYLEKSGGKCYLGSLELRPDGTAPKVDGKRTTWSSSDDDLDVCSGDLCVTCYRETAKTAVPSSSPSSGGKCTGSADSCSSVGASSCSDQGGCHYTIGSDVTSTSDDGCEGSSRPCSDYDKDAAGCKNQSGCSWQ